MEEGKGVCRILVGRLEGKRPLGGPRRRWEDNIKIDVREIGIDGTNWIRLAQDIIIIIKDQLHYAVPTPNGVSWNWSFNLFIRFSLSLLLIGE
jgi:hypothetical protein